MPADDPPPFRCTWRLEGPDAASVGVSGQLTAATAPELAETLRAALRDARLVLLDLHAVTGVDEAATHVIIEASIGAREAGKRLLAIGAPPQAEALRSSGGLDWHVPPAPPQEPAVPANPVNARILAARVMRVPAPGLWLHGSDGTLRRGWADDAFAPSPGIAVELYLAGDDTVNGWREPRSGVAVNQRWYVPPRDPATASALLCQGPCGVLWRTPDPAALLDHGEHCLTCAGPLAFP